VRLAFKHAESDQRTGKGHSVSIGTGKIVILWILALVWIIGAASLTHNANIALYGVTLLIVAAVSSIHVGWLIDRDHLAHDRVCKASVSIETVQPAIDATTALMAGWMAHEAVNYGTQRAGLANSQPDPNVVDIRTHMPVPPQRSDADRAMRNGS